MKAKGGFMRLKYFLSVFFFLISENLSAATFWDIDPHEARKLINQRIFAIEAERHEVGQVAEATVDVIGRKTPVRVYTPNSKLDEYPVILFIHGGAWVAGNLDTHDYLARYLCQEVEALVVSVGYTNSPEGKYPLPLDQCYDVLLWMIKNSQVLHGDASRLAVVGDSAGGNMAAALCLLTRDRHGPAIDLQVLINPATDLSGNGTLEKQGDDLDTVRWYATQYVKDPKDANIPYVSPLLEKDLSKLPQALIILAEKDELRGQGQKYADRLIAAGIPTNVFIQWNADHLAGNGARASISARESLDVAVAVLKGTFVR